MFCMLLTWIPLYRSQIASILNMKVFQMYRVDAEHPSQSLHTPTTVGVIMQGPRHTVTELP